MAKGKIKVKNPNTRLLFLLDLNSFMSSSRPAMNMMYKRPIVENSSMAEFFSRILSPNGPITTPEIINPIIPGIFNFLSRMGDNRIIKRIKENISTGFSNGNSNSCPRCSKKSFMLLIYPY
jgi:hypothetical protein